MKFLVTNGVRVGVTRWHCGCVWRGRLSRNETGHVSTSILAGSYTDEVICSNHPSCTNTQDTARPGEMTEVEKQNNKRMSCKRRRKRSRSSNKRRRSTGRGRGVPVITDWTKKCQVGWVGSSSVFLRRWWLGRVRSRHQVDTGQARLVCQRWGWSRTRCYRERDRDGVREAEKVIKMTVWSWSLHCGALVRAAVPVTFTREGCYTRRDRPWGLTTRWCAKFSSRCEICRM